jgi:ribonuclease HI
MMGAGVAWHQEADMHRERENPPEGKGINGTPREERGSRRQKEEEPQSVSRRVAGNLSSTRAELAAIAQAAKIAIETDLIILIDSAAAIRRLTWFRRKDFRPHPRRTKDYDIMQEIVLRLDERGRHRARTTMVKVHGHTGEPLHAVADAMATEGADRKMEADEHPLYEIPEPANLMFVVKEGDNGRKAKGQWSPKVKTCIREHEAERLWDRKSAGTWAEKFHSREGTGRRELGVRGDTAVRRLGGDRVDKEPDTALLPSSKDVQEVGDENGR